MLAACEMPGDAAPILKIGLVAPFEGLGRPLGYALLPAVQVAIDEANAAGAFGRYRVALVSLNDNDDPATAAQQVRALALDPAVLAVLGPWSSETVAATVPGLATAGLPALAGAPAVGMTGGQRSLCPTPAAVADMMVTRALELNGGGSDASRLGLLGSGNALATGLRQAAGQHPGVILADPGAGRATLLFAGNAAEAADEMAIQRAGGWQGRTVGGPDLARSWFIGRAGAGSEGSLAVVCTEATPLPEGFAARYRAAGGSVAGPEAVLAYGGARVVLAAVASDIRSHGRPTRAGAAAALAAQSLSPQLTWLQVSGGRWTTADHSP